MEAAGSPGPGGATSPHRDTLTQNIDNSTPLLTFCMLQIRYPVPCHYPQLNVPSFFTCFYGSIKLSTAITCRISGYPRLVVVDTSNSSTSASTDRYKRRRLALFWCLCWIQLHTRHLNEYFSGKCSRYFQLSFISGNKKNTFRHIREHGTYTKLF